MRNAILFLVLYSAAPMYAQDESQQILLNQQIQQNIQAAQQANQANLDAMQASQQAAQNASDATSSGPVQAMIPRPRFSVKPGSFTTPQAVRLSDSARGATIFYTTDGWTPTTSSKQYDGPIAIDSTTHLQAIAFVPGIGASLVAEATYILPSTPPPADTTEILGGSDGVLHRGTAVPLVFAADVDSQTAQVGDKIPLHLEHEVRVGEMVLSPKDVTAQATVMHVDRTGAAGAPGVLSFRVDYMKANGVTVPLLGTETEEGKDEVKKVKSFVFIPVIGVAALAVHGQKAEILPGTLVIARIAEDTRLVPSS